MRSLILLIILIIIGGIFSDVDAKDKKVTIGWIEKVRIFPGDLVMDAKIDTGADNSSINALNQEEFTKDGKKWIKFTLTNKSDKPITIELPIVRIAKIKRRKTKTRLLRPVVLLGLCVAGVYREVEVNLADRDRFKYQLLIGRSFMRDRVLVDPSAKYTAEPICQEAPKK